MYSVRKLLQPMVELTISRNVSECALWLGHNYAHGKYTKNNNKKAKQNNSLSITFLPRKTWSPFGVGKMRDFGIRQLTGRRTPIVMEEKGIKRSCEIWDRRRISHQPRKGSVHPASASHPSIRPLHKLSCSNVTKINLTSKFQSLFAIWVFSCRNFGVLRCDQANVTSVKTTNQQCKSLPMINYSHFSFY